MLKESMSYGNFESEVTYLVMVIESQNHEAKFLGGNYLNSLVIFTYNYQENLYCLKSMLFNVPNVHYYIKVIIKSWHAGLSHYVSTCSYVCFGVKSISKELCKDSQFFDTCIF